MDKSCRNFLGENVLFLVKGISNGKNQKSYYFASRTERPFSLYLKQPDEGNNFVHRNKKIIDILMEKNMENIIISTLQVTLKATG